jgi:tetratricopeptide (TPR) repeat protein
MSVRDELLQRAARARDAKEYELARQAYCDILHQDPDDPDAMWAIAHVEYAISTIQPDADDSHGCAAIEWMRKALAHKGDVPSYHWSLGMLLEVVAPPDYGGAAAAYRAALALAPDYLPALASLAFLYPVPDRVVSLAEATGCCERALQICPTRSLWSMLAELYAYAGRAAESRDASEKATYWPIELRATLY